LIDKVLDIVTSKDLYSFLDGFRRYNQIKIHPNDWKKTTFIMEWGAFIFMVMPFELCNAPTMFWQAIMESFKEFIRDFISVLLDDFTTYGVASNHHLDMLNKCLQWCRKVRISLNPKKCIFGVRSKVLWGHIVHKEGLLMDFQKTTLIFNVGAPKNTKELVSFLGTQ
jgi:hypothetical protein